MNVMFFKSTRIRAATAVWFCALAAFAAGAPVPGLTASPTASPNATPRPTPSPTPKPTASATPDWANWETGVEPRYRKWEEPDKDFRREALTEERVVPVHKDILAWDPKRAIIAPLKEQRIQLDTKPSSYLLVNMELELSREAARLELRKFEQQIEEELRRIMRSMPPQRALTMEGKLEIKRRMIRFINLQLTEGAARELYFTRFTVLEPFQ